MSIELNWETLTTGPDGDELAHRIRDFIHSKFQAVPLPRFIKSVTVHDFQFGAIPPELELKDITDPLPDFYEEDPDVDYDDEEDEDVEETQDYEERRSEAAASPARLGHDGLYGGQRGDAMNKLDRIASSSSSTVGGGRGSAVGRPAAGPPQTPTKSAININTRMRGEAPPQDLTSPFLGVSTPGILSGGTSNFSYFHSHLASSGLSGTQTPLAAVAGAQLGGPPQWNGLRSTGRGSGRRRSLAAASQGLDGEGFTPSHSRNSSTVSNADLQPGGLGGLGGRLTPTSFLRSGQHTLREKHSVSTLAPTSVGTSRPPTRDLTTAMSTTQGDGGGGDGNGEEGESAAGNEQNESDSSDRAKYRERRIEDMQAVFRIKYAGDVKLLLTADILLDYPMPSFVGIPVRLSITGLTFDGVGVVAQIRKRVHFCFLSPEDALAAVGSASGKEAGDGDDYGDTSGGSAVAAAASSSSSASTATTPQGAAALPSPAGAGAVPGSDEKPGGNTRMGGLLQEIRVESEIGQREGGKQSLKNVGKVEKFILEQVRRIFEEEFVYPSFWTFLV
ncbi:Mitochondrial distribution and morphology protein 12 [Pyricularia grisea]|nr:Mitochondrial distribution and morphology protein 12 [Pyricularia grisea]